MDAKLQIEKSNMVCVGKTLKKSKTRMLNHRNIATLMNHYAKNG